MKALIGGLFLCLVANSLLAQEPSREQLEEAKQAFKALGGGFRHENRPSAGTR
ncbi:MAG: hypothetical protein WCJ09_27150 [Planctomycetota bacterium]